MIVAHSLSLSLSLNIFTCRGGTHTHTRATHARRVSPSRVVFRVELRGARVGRGAASRGELRAVAVTRRVHVGAGVGTVRRSTLSLPALEQLGVDQVALWGVCVNGEQYECAHYA